jgi:type I restriction enzyme, S subunit
MGEWVKYTLKELALEFAMGPFGSNIKAENFSSSGVPVIKGQNLNYYRYVGGKFDCLTEKKADELVKSNCYADDLVFTHRGTIGQVGLIPRGHFDRYVISQSGMKVTVDKKKLSPLFLFYFFKSDIGQYELLKNESQVGVPSISSPLTSLKSVEITAPDVDEQKAIAEVLSSLDDKIDLLHRQNKTLEALAETLFRHTFIDSAQDSWELGKVSDLFVLQRGFDLPIQNRREGLFPILAASGLSGFHSEFKVKGPCVTTGRSGLLGKVFYIAEDFWPLNTSLYIKQFRRGTPIFSYFFLKVLDLLSFNAGSAVPTLNRNHVHELETLLPPQQLPEWFDEAVSPAFQKLETNNRQIKKLEKLRDTLLPKLMNGDVRVQYTEVS